jgi:hypothetical protein
MIKVKGASKKYNHKQTEKKNRKKKALKHSSSL